ncbi:AAA ATPase [[Leptolyngbya] sp. PCC 7376]|nr:AAA ATPase [[Leptolyngbya] sp. PCC 7376]
MTDFWDFFESTVILIFDIKNDEKHRKVLMFFLCENNIDYRLKFLDYNEKYLNNASIT